MTFYKMQNDCGTSSLYKPLGNSIGPVKEIVSVPVYSLKHFFDLFPWDKYEFIDYIKIDAQGSDIDILKGAENYLTERVVYITAEPEYTQYEKCDHNNENSMYDYLHSQGFIRVYHPNTQDPTFLNKKFLHLRENIYICQS